MKIIFSNGVEMPYLNAYSLERDFKDGYTRPSIEVEIPFSVTTFNEIYELTGTNFTLVGDEILDTEGTPTGEIPTSEWTDYSIDGKISVEDGKITFKAYKLSDTEIERDDYRDAVDELLLIIAEGEEPVVTEEPVGEENVVTEEVPADDFSEN